MHGIDIDIEMKYGMKIWKRETIYTEGYLSFLNSK